MPEIEAKSTKGIAALLKRRPVMISLIAVLLVAVAATGYLIMRPPKPTTTNDNRAESNQTNSDKLVRRAIDGVWDKPENANLYPIAVMIENLASIRPQGALDQSSLVYEALVEGGITRLVAFFVLAGPIEDIGPVRSARPYYLDWVRELNALYAHVGGSPQAMSEISSKGIFNLDQFYDARFYWRKDLARALEHNVFTASKFLTFALRDKQAPAQGDFEAWKFKDDVPLDDRPTDEKNITINFSSRSYLVRYVYDRDTNTYNRFQADDPHLVMNTGVQISPKNVVVQYVKTSLADAQRLAIETTGSGQALVFRDGRTTTGQWRKDSLTARTKYYDNNGQEIVFNAGQTWVEIVPTDREVSFN